VNVFCCWHNNKLSFLDLYDQDSITSNTSYKTLEKFVKIYILELEW